ncbi:gamma-glutamylmethylamide synthetase [Roseovarius halotolerans]|uniref:Glutamine synthetase 3 n=1 Tax=Roseovarius halotolerans TaxID=505353 RepID=A0A1X6YLJ6_9RHOB|nr:type III glutamate--ammonia ligase [Roseovarius halotolerans]RKT34370.1 gamma-glutamylmethylamide synthetase [Roseovarius halotolerans]SLN24351.1 Glutamine synthetase 3 [Roseovarius halotolerans]
MTTDLAAYAAERGVKYFMISFTDLFGGQRAKLVPAQAIADMQADGAGFAGFATWLDMTPAHPDMLAVPDPDSVTQLPWNPEVAWVAANPVMEGEDVAQAPRNVLRRLIEEAASEGLHVKTGVEAEYFLLTPDGNALSDPYDTAEKPCYDQQAVMRRYDVVREICDYMLDLGWGPYQNDHEDANGQFEMNWEFDDVLVTADRHSFFKFMTKSIAEKHGFRATFMPKPIEGLTGNGAHLHISVWDAPGAESKVNVFADDNMELGLSEKGRNFLGGIMKHATAMAAITNPTVNSYKRINAPRTSSGATWAPNTVTWTSNNRTHMVRVPGPGRFELRLPDGAANPYLLQAVTLAAGLDGVRTKADPGKRHEIDMYAEGHKVRGAPQLPLNMLDAIRAYDRNKVLKAAMGEEFSQAFIKMKTKEWNSFVSHFSRWEKENTLDI